MGTVTTTNSVISWADSQSGGYPLPSLQHSIYLSPEEGQIMPPALKPAQNVVTLPTLRGLGRIVQSWLGFKI